MSYKLHITPRPFQLLQLYKVSFSLIWNTIFIYREALFNPWRGSSQRIINTYVSWLTLDVMVKLCLFSIDTTSASTRGNWTFSYLYLYNTLAAQALQCLNISSSCLSSYQLFLFYGILIPSFVTCWILLSLPLRSESFFICKIWVRLHFYYLNMLSSNKTLPVSDGGYCRKIKNK